MYFSAHLYRSSLGYVYLSDKDNYRRNAVYYMQTTTSQGNWNLWPAAKYTVRCHLLLIWVSTDTICFRCDGTSHNGCAWYTHSTDLLWPSALVSYYWMTPPSWEFIRPSTSFTWCWSTDCAACFVFSSMTAFLLSNSCSNASPRRVSSNHLDSLNGIPDQWSHLVNGVQPGIARQNLQKEDSVSQ